MPADGATLADLFNGGSLDAGGTRFSGWQLLDLDSTAAPSPDLSQIVVLPLVDNPANPGLQFTANGQLSISGMNAIDLSFRYRAQVLGGGNTLTAHTSSMTGVTFGGTGGITYITDSMTTGLGADLGSTLALADHEIDFFQFTNTANVSPQSDIFVTTNASICQRLLTDSLRMARWFWRATTTRMAKWMRPITSCGAITWARPRVRCPTTSTVVPSARRSTTHGDPNSGARAALH
jgi:hypothetical protein